MLLGSSVDFEVLTRFGKNDHLPGCGYRSRTVFSTNGFLVRLHGFAG